MKALGIDIGGSALKAAVVDTKTGELLSERARIETPDHSTPAAVAKVAAQLAKKFSFKGPVGIGFPGVVHGGVIHTAANLHKSWPGTDGAALFSKAIGSPTVIFNDADAAGIAEMGFGAGRGQNGTVLLLTLGTGIGSALFFGGKLYPNTEFGHVLWKDGRSAEKWCAASVLTKQKLTWASWGKRLNGYLQLMELLTQPELVILGGGVSADSAKFFKYLKLRAPIVPAQLRNDAGIVGAALAAANAERS